MRVKIHREGTNILLVLLLIMIVINLSAWMFIRPAVIPIVFSSICGVLYLLVVNFFRSPRRTFRGDRVPNPTRIRGILFSALRDDTKRGLDC